MARVVSRSSDSGDAMGEGAHADPGDARSVLETYLAKRHRALEANAASAPESGIRRWGRLVVPQRFRLGARLATTAVVARGARRRATKVAGASNVRLHLGSGPVRKADWVNVDLVGDPVDLAWNILKPLPFDEGSVEAIFHEHVLEHLTSEDGYVLARESFRVLQPSGILRIGVPDCGAPHIAWPEAPTRLLALQEFFAEPGHRTMYDFETLALVLRAAGFQAVEQRAFGQSRLEPAPDSEHRRVGTLYVEAVK